MLRLVLVSLVAVGVAGFVTAVDPDPKKVQAEIELMDGSWTLTSGEVGGTKFPDEVLKSLTLVLKGEKSTLKTPNGDDIGRVKLDPTKKPKELDVTGVEGPNKGKTFLAIYELDGDTLTVCYDLDGKTRPTEFKSASGTKLFLAVYKRKKE